MVVGGRTCSGRLEPTRRLHSGRKGISIHVSLVSQKAQACTEERRKCRKGE